MYLGKRENTINICCVRDAIALLGIFQYTKAVMDLQEIGLYLNSRFSIEEDKNYFVISSL
jgi:hypothetical protein